MDIIVRKENKYHNVPIQALYVEDTWETDVCESMDVYLEKYGMGVGNTFKAEVVVENFMYKVRFGGVRRKEERMYGLNTESEKETIDKAIRYLGGLRVKSKKGLLMELEGIIQNNRHVIETERIKVGSVYPGRKSVNLPNIYSSRGICWGNVQRKNTIYGIGNTKKILNEYMMTEFNDDIVQNCVTSSSKVFDLLEDVYERSIGESDVVDTAREVYLEKMDREGSLELGTLRNIVICTVFNLDNMYFDYIHTEN